MTLVIPLPVQLTLPLPYNDIFKQITLFSWRHEVCPANHFSCTKYNHLILTDFHAISVNMKFNILAWS